MPWRGSDNKWAQSRQAGDGNYVDVGALYNRHARSLARAGTSKPLRAAIVDTHVAIAALWIGVRCAF